MKSTQDSTDRSFMLDPLLRESYSLHVLLFLPLAEYVLNLLVLHFAPKYSVDSEPNAKGGLAPSYHSLARG